MLTTGAFADMACGVEIGYCLSAWASKDLASSRSFLSLAITRQAASCYRLKLKLIAANCNGTLGSENIATKPINHNILKSISHRGSYQDKESYKGLISWREQMEGKIKIAGTAIIFDNSLFLDKLTLMSNGSLKNVTNLSYLFYYVVLFSGVQLCGTQLVTW